MKHLVIKNLGPIANADLELKKINVIVGPQSSGKSCVLKTACYCTWVEKRIELAQSAEYFEKDNTFITTLVNYHKLHGYVKENTYIDYESDFMRFFYDNATKNFTFNWKEDRRNYSSTTVTFIPAERNIVSAIPNWFDIRFKENYIRDFIGDWIVAREATVKEIEVLNLGVRYSYKPNSDKDIVVAKGVKLELANTSSGLQSLIPLFVHLNYINKLQYTENETTNNRCDIFLEEPELNLFPPTQTFLIDWLLDIVDSEHPGTLFVSTHSEYVLTSFLELDRKDIGLIITNTPKHEGISVVVASAEEIQEVYDYGVDVFFNNELFF